MKRVTFLTPATYQLKRYSSLNTKSIRVIDSEDPENQKYINNTKMKLGLYFTAATPHLTHAKVI